MKKIYSILFILFLTLTSSFAASIKGGNISVSSVDNLTFRIRVNLYVDVDHINSKKLSDQVQICFGDANTGKAEIKEFERLPDNKTVKTVYETTHTYGESGIYQIGVAFNQREGIFQNLIDSENSDIFLWTVINTNFDNVTPIVPKPVFDGGVKQNFVVNLNHANTDQDSISIRLQSLSTRTAGTCGVRNKNANYFFPNDVTKNGTFKVDNATKSITWTAPEKEGQYLYAYIIDEWRNGIKVSESYHEATVNVKLRTGATVSIPAYEPAIETIPLNIIEDLEKVKLHLSAYPVPTVDMLTFQIVSTSNKPVIVQLINIQGKVVKEITSGELSDKAFVSQFDLRALTSGVYIIRASNGEFSASQKVVR